MTYVDAGGGVTIGDDVSIAHGVTIMSRNHGFSDPDVCIRDQPLDLRPVSIESNVWIGAKATVLGNVTIGTGTIVGAGAVVTKSTPQGAIMVGVPASAKKSWGGGGVILGIIFQKRKHYDDFSAGGLHKWKTIKGFFIGVLESEPSSFFLCGTRYCLAEKSL
jgi:serine acetyltransferase